MRCLRTVPLLLIVLAEISSVAAAEARRCGAVTGDEVAVSSARIAADEACPCGTFDGSAAARRHGAYLRCVKATVKAAVAAGNLRAACKRAVLRCAARSTCGAPSKAVCCRVRASGRLTASVVRAAISCRESKRSSACVANFPSACDACAADAPEGCEGGSIGLRIMTLVDASRTTPAAGAGFPALPQRTIQTWVWYRAEADDSGEPTEFGREGATVDLSNGPYPLVVTCHGNDGHPTTHFPLVAQLVAEGYVVAGPVFPLTNRDGPGLPASLVDLQNQPGDVSFVIDELLTQSAASGPLGGAIDPGAIGVQGHSLGGFTTAAVAHHSCCQDPRVGASALLASGLAPILPGEFFRGPDVPLFVVHGDADTTLPLASGQQAFAAAPPPKYFLAIAGGTHDSFLRHPGAQADGTARALAAFYDAHLRSAATALSPALDALHQHDLFTVVAESPLCECALPWCACP